MIRVVVVGVRQLPHAELWVGGRLQTPLTNGDPAVVDVRIVGDAESGKRRGFFSRGRRK